MILVLLGLGLVVVLLTHVRLISSRSKRVGVPSLLLSLLPSFIFFFLLPFFCFRPVFRFLCYYFLRDYAQVVCVWVRFSMNLLHNSKKWVKEIETPGDRHGPT